MPSRARGSYGDEFWCQKPYVHFLKEKAARFDLAINDHGKAHLFVIVLVARKWLTFRPALHLQVGDDVRSGRRRRFIAPASTRFFDTGMVVPELPVAHAKRRTPGKLVQPPMHL